MPCKHLLITLVVLALPSLGLAKDDPQIPMAPPAADPEKVKLAVEDFKKAYKTQDEDKRKAAIEALGAFPAKDTALAATKGLGDPSVAVRKVTAQVLGEMKQLDAVPALLAAFKANEHDVLTETEIIKALGILGDKRAVDTLSKNLWATQDRTIISWRIRALGNIWDKSAITALIQMLSVAGGKRGGGGGGKGWAYRAEIFASLKHLTGQDLGDRDDWNNWWHKNERSFQMPPKPTDDSWMEGRRGGKGGEGQGEGEGKPKKGPKGEGNPGEPGAGDGDTPEPGGEEGPAPAPEDPAPGDD